MSPEHNANLLLMVGGELFGIPLAKVLAVTPYQTPGPVPFQQSRGVGALLHRGQFMGVVDLGDLLKIRADLDPSRAVIAVMESEGGFVGLVAESSKGILRESEISEVAKALGRFEGPHLDSTIKAGERVIHLLNFESLINAVAQMVEAA